MNVKDPHSTSLLIYCYQQIKVIGLLISCDHLPSYFNGSFLFIPCYHPEYLHRKIQVQELILLIELLQIQFRLWLAFSCHY
jgi:hypothetical protein